MTIVLHEEAISRLWADHDLLLTRTEGLTEAQLAASYRVASGPLGDFCESLHDLIAHVLMWDEINLAVLAEAAAGRVHWSLDPCWETPDATRILNRSGVEAGRLLPAGLLLPRLRTVRDALLAELGRHSSAAWTEAGRLPELVRGFGALAIGAGRDPLRDDARAYAARLDADGVAVTHIEYAETMHAFLNFCGVLSAGDHAIERIAAELTRTLAGRPGEQPSGGG